ncbi:MAG: LacI family DNA-binding transcriptional regulator [Alphaproteobacteria bacterium]|nr:LacI family DNA-binding transcriptional regulator [Alphaproteobacteria bacterium]
MVARPTITDLAKKAGVSVATVDRVLNGRLPVREDTAQRVVIAAEAIGYHATGLLKRRLSETPKRRFGFLLQKPDQFYQNLGNELATAAKSLRNVEAKPILEFMEELMPNVIAERLYTISRKVDALAVVAMDYPVVNEAVESIVASGKPVFTLLSNVTSPVCCGHFGADSRKCGRIAGWTISRLARHVGKIGILVGSHRYLNQELSEISFRTYMREHAPDFQLLEPIVNLDDTDIAYEAITKMEAENPDLVGIYVSGGGQEGLIKALRERDRGERLIAVCNELTPATKAALHDGVIDLTLGTPFAALSRRLVEVMAKATIGAEMPHLPPLMLPPEIHMSENI